MKDAFIPNEFFILRNKKKSALALYDPFIQKIQRVDKRIAYGITPHNAEQTFALNALMQQLIAINCSFTIGENLK